MSLNLKTLIDKLNDNSRDALSRAASLCVGMGHYEVEIEHALLALLERDRCDLALLTADAGIEARLLEADLRRAVEGLRTGNTRTPVFSSDLARWLEQSWVAASLGGQGEARVRSGHMLLALLDDGRLAQLAARISPRFERCAPERMRRDFDVLTAASEEAATPAAQGGAARDGKGALALYTVDLTALARAGKIDPVIGRAQEIRQVIDILMRRRQNNPILTGEAGVGKTAVVEGLALRIAAGEVPDTLRGVELRSLDLGLLQAGASVKGEFEQRLKGVIDEVARSAQPVILFIDEAHTMIGAGGQAGQNDAANLLKPALARGQLRTVAATTWSEYKRYFEKDAALARRFQVVKVEEPSAAVACDMLRAMVPLMEAHFGVRIVDEAVAEAVRLSQRYISGRQLPDKAVSVLDTACARVALGQRALPAALEDAVRRGEAIAAELAALEREPEHAERHDARLRELRALQDACETEQAACRARWEQERELANGIAGASGELRRTLTSRLQALQGQAPLVPLQVDGGVVAQVVAGWTGVPLGAMVKDDIETALALQSLLAQRVLGQDHAMEAVARSVQTARAGLDDPDKPKAVLLFVGPSGTGKTETAAALSELLYGGRGKLISINLSEFQEAHSVALLKGAPPGYVGYGEGGVLTEAVRRNPYSVVLLDELEKAHPDVLELFYQVFDRGVLDDAEGCGIDFRNTVIIATSNVGSGLTMQSCVEGQRPEPAALDALLRPHLVRQFRPALLGRMQVVPFFPLDDDVLAQIVAQKLERIARRVAAQHKAVFAYDEAVVEAVLARCTEVDSGARNVDHILNGSLLPGMAREVLGRMAQQQPVERIAVTAGEDGHFSYTIA